MSDFERVMTQIMQSQRQAKTSAGKWARVRQWAEALWGVFQVFCLWVGVGAGFTFGAVAMLAILTYFGAVKP